MRGSEFPIRVHSTAADSKIRIQLPMPTPSAANVSLANLAVLFIPSLTNCLIISRLGSRYILSGLLFICLSKKKWTLKWGRDYSCCKNIKSDFANESMVVAAAMAFPRAHTLDHALSAADLTTSMWESAEVLVPGDGPMTNCRVPLSVLHNGVSYAGGTKQDAISTVTSPSFLAITNSSYWGLLSHKRKIAVHVAAGMHISSKRGFPTDRFQEAATDYTSTNLSFTVLIKTAGNYSKSNPLELGWDGTPCQSSVIWNYKSGQWVTSKQIEAASANIMSLLHC